MHCFKKYHRLTTSKYAPMPLVALAELGIISDVFYKSGSHVIGFVIFVGVSD